MLSVRYVCDFCPHNRIFQSFYVLTHLGSENGSSGDGIASNAGVEGEEGGPVDIAVDESPVPSPTVMESESADDERNELTRRSSTLTTVPATEEELAHANAVTYSHHHAVLLKLIFTPIFTLAVNWGHFKNEVVAARFAPTMAAPVVPPMPAVPPLPTFQVDFHGGVDATSITTPLIMCVSYHTIRQLDYTRQYSNCTI